MEGLTPQEPAPSQIDDKKARDERRIKRYRVLLPVLIAVAFLTWTFTTNYIPSESMVPTLKPGDHILTMRSWMAYPGGKMPSRGDVVVFALPSSLPDFDEIANPEEKRRVSEAIQQAVAIPTGSLRHVKGDILIKRVVALPGETVEVRDKDIFINGRKLDQSYFGIQGKPDPTIYYGFAVEEPLRLKDDEVFVLGDNIGNSEDGRIWGPLKRRNIVGKLVSVLWNDGGKAVISGGEVKTATHP